MDDSRRADTEAALERARGLQAEGRFGEAASVLREAAENDRTDGEILHQLGLSLFQAGRAEEGVRWLRQALQRNPEHAEALANTAVALRTLGRDVEALEMLQRSVSLAPNFGPAQFNLGQWHCQAGRLKEGERALARSAELLPRDGRVWRSWGIAASYLGDWEGAAQRFRQALSLDETDAATHAALGKAYGELGELASAYQAYESALRWGGDEIDSRIELAGLAMGLGRHSAAAEHLRRLIELGVADEAVYTNLAVTYQALQRWGHAMEAIDQALEIAPESPQALCAKASLCLAQGRPSDCVESALLALQQEPGLEAAWSNLGAGYLGVKQFDEARQAFQAAHEVNPDRAEHLNGLGLALRELERFEEMAICFRRALELQPNQVSFLENYAVGLLKSGKPVESERLLVQAIGLDDQRSSAWEQLGKARYELGLHEESRQAYLRSFELGNRGVEARMAFAARQIANGSIDEATLLAYHRQAAEALEAGIEPKAPDLSDSIEGVKAGGKLRLGFVSADFRRHSVAFFLLPLFQRLDRGRFEVICYSCVSEPDQTTAQFRDLADAWRDISQGSADELTKLAREDAISILIDLSGFTAGNRLVAFARRAAPVQASWLGYAHATGLSAMDARLVDRDTDPCEGATASEETAYLEGCFLCYQPPAELPDSGSPPLLVSKSATFGCFNNFAKLGEASIALFARVLKAAPGSSLLLKSFYHDDAATGEHLLRRFEQHGVEAERVSLLPPQPTLVEHLELYRRVDVALDPTPYNGTTTTCEALAMGVPVVSLTGRRHAARVGRSLLRAAGVPQWIAETESDYVALASDLASDASALLEWRKALPSRLRRSTLWDAEGFARRMGDCFERLWETVSDRSAR
ncbi:tetratricopeptide repeat protein [Pelagicoccus sp. SDUM812003]|uniref:tetratricopeptide repeat protein n=1 Tax=Pelagicoccus sp. SDUM812003 TaxID=3041267 RepID=UPI00280C603A|nr:tetratricopeptide repeat protein [Pelagicoccus sp. SDUM812003]MDQ8201531.1 tetratricopeptide repeat protein [Pelagicoccus sp. SDUM812003]